MSANENNETLLCKNLSLSIWFKEDPECSYVKIRLVDKLALKKVENEVQIAAAVSRKTSYYITEAIVIAIRRLVSEAVKQGLISVNPGKSATSPSRTPPGGVSGITLLIPPDL